MAVKLTVIGKIVLGAGHSLDIHGVAAHHSTYESAAHHGCQERILTVALTGTTPARVTYGLHHRAPECKPLGACLEYGACLIGYDRCLKLQQIGVPA